MKTTKLNTTAGFARIATIAIAILGMGMSTASAQRYKTVYLWLGGKSFGIVTDPVTNLPVSKNLYAKSVKPVIASTKYKYTISGTCEGTGMLASMIPAGTTIAQAMETIKPGSSWLLSRTVTTTTGTLVSRTVTGTQNLMGYNITVSLVLQGKVGTDGIVTACIKNLKVTGLPITVTGTVKLGAGSKMTVTKLP